MGTDNSAASIVAFATENSCAHRVSFEHCVAKDSSDV
jgi:hypothetical protein